MAHKVVHITTNLGIGGAETQLVTLIQVLGAEYIHTVIAFYDGVNRERLEKLGVHVYIVRGYFFRYDPTLFFRLLYYLWSINPIIVHTQLWAAGILGTVAARLWGVSKVVYVVHQAHTDSFVRALFEHISFWGAHIIVAVSNSVARALELRHMQGASKKLVVIPNGIILPVQQLQHSTFSGKLLLGMVGRLTPIKNHAGLLRVFARCNFDGDLVIVGGGPERAALTQLVRQLNLESRVIWAGEVNAHEWYCRLDGYVSNSYSEGLSIALLEALSYGIPVIITSPQQHHDIVRDGIDGWVVPVGHEQALYNALVDWADSKTRREQYGRSGKKRVLDFSAEAMGAEYRRIFTENLVF